MTLRNGTSLWFAVLSSLTTVALAAHNAGDQVNNEMKTRALANYARLPLSFEENRGQAATSVKFLSHGTDYSILLTPAKIFLNLASKGKAARQSTIGISFPGANSSPKIAASEKETAVSSYFLGNDPAKWVSGAPNYARVCYQELYPGVDVAFYGNQGKLEYDFVVAPGGNPKAIQLQFEGVTSMRLEGGDLILKTPSGEIRHHRPVVYQETGGVRKVLDGRYAILPHQRVGFEIAAYDASKTLVIDPTLSFGTYLGSSQEEVFGISSAAATTSYPAVAMDSAGFIYITGFTQSASSFTWTPRILTAAQGGGGSTVFVVKMSPSGDTLMYSVAFGGTLTDIGGAIAADKSGNAYVTGSTTSINFPITAGVPQKALNGGTNAFVTKVNAAGTALVYSTYLGGSGSFWGRGIAVDNAANAYVTGTANYQCPPSGCVPFPLSSPLSSSPAAGFLTEINAAGSAFVYSTYLSPGIGYGVAVDSSGAAYVTGSTGTATVATPAQGYVLKVDAGGSGYGYGAILLGHSGAGMQTIGFGIAVDPEDNAYVAGMTNDASFPQISSGAGQTTFGGGVTDGFAIKLNSAGGLVYGTYIGGLGSNILPERGSGIGVDAEGNAYVSGTTECIAFPSVNTVAGARNGGPSVLMKGIISGSNSDWSPSTLSGNFDQVTALAFDSSGDLYAGASAYNAAGGGVFKLPNGSSTWISANAGITTTTIDSIAVDPNTPSTVYAAGSGNLYQTTNGGTSWTKLGQTIGTPAVIAVGKSSPSTVYVGWGTSLIYSTNAGSSWNSPATPPAGTIYSLAVDPNSPAAAYVGTYNGVYQTVNGGIAWTLVDTGIDTNPPGAAAATGLAVYSVSNPSVIYAATPNGLYYTSNASSTGWTLANLPTQIGTPSLVAVDRADNVYLSFLGAGISTASSGGLAESDWSPLTYNGLTQNQITALATGPTTSGTAYAGIVAATEAFMTEISPGGNFVSSTCIGGSDNNLGQSIAVSPTGGVVVSGLTVATNFPVTPGAVQPYNAGLYDAFVMGIDLPAGIASPGPGIELPGTSAAFSWNSVSGASGYQLFVGTSPGGSNIFNGTVSGTSQTVDFIPCTGTASTIYVQLATVVNGVTQATTDYSYTCRNAIGDFNGSGFQDLLWQNNSSREVNLNYFGSATPVAQGWNYLNAAGSPGWHVVGAADFDGNGTPDLVWQNDTTRQVTVNYYGGAGGAVYQGWAYLNEAGVPGWSVVAVADMNGDGTPDLIWQNDSTKQVTVNYYGGPGGAVYQGWNYLNEAGAPGWTVVAAADFDQNGTPDLVWQNLTTQQVTVNYYGGAGGAVYQGWAYLNSTGVPGWTVVGAQDFNADGVPDLVWENNTTNQVTVNFYGGVGGATYEGWNWINSTGYTGWQVKAVADFSGNGEPDLVWLNTATRQVTVNYYGYGGAVYQSAATLNTGVAGWHVVGSGDFDGNGVPDLVWQNDATRQVTVNYYGGAGGTVYTGWNYLNSTGVPGWTVVAVADMNGDGVPDLIWQNDTTKQVTVNYYGGAGGAVYQGWNYLNSTGVPGWTVVGAADFDGNGVPDLVWQNLSTGQVTVNYYGGAGGATYIGWNWLNTTGMPGWNVVGASDFDGNGVPDLVWENPATGQAQVAYYGGPGGAVYKGWNWLNSTGNPGWTVIVPRSR